MRLALSVVILAVLVVVWIFDVYAGFRGNHDETVSSLIFEWSTRWPVIPFGVGVAMGHIFW